MFNSDFKPSYYISYKEAEQYIIDGDLLLYRPTTFFGKIISKAANSYYSHVGLAGKLNGRLMSLQMLFAGGSAVSLENEVIKYPGIIDVYRVADCVKFVFPIFDEIQKQLRLITLIHKYDRKKAVNIMMDFCAIGNYGFWNLLKISFRYLAGIRLFITPPTIRDLNYKIKRPICSEAVSFAIKNAFTDLVVGVTDKYTHPAELARSGLCTYLFTLT